MPHTNKAYLNDFSACKNFKELWESLHNQLQPFKINTIFYGIAYSNKSIEEIGLLRTLVYKTSHPKAYRKLLSTALRKEMPSDDKFKIILDEELTAKQVVLTDTPYFIWGNPNNWNAAITIEREVDKQLIELELVTGVTIPLRNEKLLSEIGLSAGLLSKNVFNQIWADSSEQILKITHEFNQYVLNVHMQSFIGLTDLQKEVFLKHLFSGSSKQVAQHFKCSERNISDILSTIRKKLNANSNEQAMVKAQVLGASPLE